VIKTLVNLLVEPTPPPAKPWPWYGFEEEDAGEVEVTDESFITSMYDDAHDYTAFAGDPQGEPGLDE
jgi:hypothetical protein